MKFVINIIYSSYQIRKFTIKQKKKKKIIKDDDLRLNRPIIINSNFDYFTKSGGIFFFFFFLKKKRKIYSLSVIIQFSYSIGQDFFLIRLLVL
jgi:hypothetical protein